METKNKEVITVETTVNAPVEKVWEYFSKPEHIVKWNNASEDWFTPKAENNCKEGGGFNYRMEAKDGSFGFNFFGSYTKVIPNECIEYTLGDERNVKIEFAPEENKTKMRESFDAETTNPSDVQKKGWQSILDNFKKYTESN